MGARGQPACSDCSPSCLVSPFVIVGSPSVRLGIPRPVWQVVLAGLSASEEAGVGFTPWGLGEGEEGHGVASARTVKGALCVLASHALHLGSFRSRQALSQWGLCWQGTLWGLQPGVG